MMPIRKSTRVQNWAKYVAVERRHNRQVREAAIAAARLHHDGSYLGPAPRADLDDDPPPF